MNQHLVLVTDPIGGNVSALAEVLEAHGARILTPSTPESWRQHANEADALIVNLVSVDDEALQSLKRCRVIARLGVGVNNIDVAAAHARGIVVTNVPEYCREEVSDHTLALILASVRKLPLANADVQQAHWNQLGYRPIHRLGTLTLGLVGFGRLAQALARKAAALGMRVIAHDPNLSTSRLDEVSLLSFEALLRDADIVSLHVPLSPETCGMIGAPQLRKMKRGAILVNTARGELIDEHALAESLDEAHLAGAALDVLAIEPIPSGSPLLGRPNVLLTPHIAFYSEESLSDLQRTAAEDVVSVLSGRAPRYRVS